MHAFAIVIVIAFYAVLDFGAGTSSRSTKLLWAGSRYLVQALVKLFRPVSLASPISSVRSFLQDFNMVLNCHKERAFLLREQPHLTQWLPIAVPMDRWLLWPKPPFDYPPAALGPLGLFAVFFKFYDLLGGWCSPPSHIMTKSRTLRKFPQLNDKIHYCCVFYEGAHNDSRTALALALTAANHGAAVVNHTEVVDFVRNNDDPTSSDRVTGVMCRDLVDPTAAPFEVKGKSIVLCGGPFTDQLREIEHRSMSSATRTTPAVQGASGIHVVLPGYYAPSGMGMVDMDTSDGRFLFFLPWLGHTLVGTTDSPEPSPTMRPEPPEVAIQWVLDEASKHLRMPVRRQDVLSAWSGTRPLASDPHASSTAGTAQASRDHVVSVDPASGLMFVAGGKWTTYREMAEDAVNQVVQRLRSDDGSQSSSTRSSQSTAGTWGPCVTLTTPLEGREGWDPLLAVRLQQAVPGLPASQAQHLASTYGGHALNVLSCVPKATASAMNEPTQTEKSNRSQDTSLKTEGKAVSSEPVPGHLLVPGFPYVEQEVVWAARHEYCSTAAAVRL
jgi:glycerol-3-phosphate dehydrogenase